MRISTLFKVNKLSGYYPSLGLSFILGASLVYLTAWGNRADFISLCIPFSLAGAAYLLLVLNQKTVRETHMLVKAGFLIRISMLFFLPGLSDDFYRFWWDGTLINHGINPFAQSPSEIMGSEISAELKNKLASVFPLLNSPDYRTVYPPFTQITSSIAAHISGTDLFLFSILLKIMVLISDMLLNFSVLGILRHMNLGIQHVLIFFLNPLTILELNGNLHYESWMISFLALAIYAWISGSKKLSGFALGASFLSKMLSALTLPFFLAKRSGIKGTAGFLMIFLAMCAIMLLTIPLRPESLKGYALYFRIFEFNSSFYYILREWAEKNQLWTIKAQTGSITMTLFLILVSIIVIYTYRKRSINATFEFKPAWWTWTGFLIMGSTVHPWYVLPVLFLGLFSYPYTSIFWSLIAFISYLHYDSNFSDHFNWFRIGEYFLLFGIFIWEHRTIKRKEIARTDLI